jgi:hypothetical protein
MRPQDIEIGVFYRFKAHPGYSYAKAIEVLRPKQGVNTNRYKVVKCEHVISKKDTMGFIRYFRPSDLVKEGN